MPPLDCCRASVQNLIRAEDVRGRFELGQNPVFKELQDNQRVESKQVVIGQIEKSFDN
jgi:hypothetical protein